MENTGSAYPVMQHCRWRKLAGYNTCRDHACACVHLVHSASFRRPDIYDVFAAPGLRSPATFSKPLIWMKRSFQICMKNIPDPLKGSLKPPDGFDHQSAERLTRPDAASPSLFDIIFWDAVTVVVPLIPFSLGGGEHINMTGSELTSARLSQVCRLKGENRGRVDWCFPVWGTATGPFIK